MASGRALRWALGLLLVGCGPTGGRPKDLAEQSRPIIGGTLDPNDPAVVALARRTVTGLNPFCSGTLIAPSTVITAAHCVNVYGTGASYVAVFGGDVSQPSETVGVIAQIPHPEFNRSGQLENDVALFHLERPVIAVPPLPLNTTPLTSTDVGRALRHVGFGVYAFSENGASQFDGRKRTAEHQIQSVTARLVESAAPASQTCMGDSGGPGLLVTDGNATERVAALVSFGDAACARYGDDTRADVYALWVEQTYANWEVPGCQRDGHCQSGCNPVDLDCVCAPDGQCNPGCPDPGQDPDCTPQCGAGNGCADTPCTAPDPDCHPVGGPCKSPMECKSRQCLSAPDGGTYCSAPCAWSSDCPQGMRCQDGLCEFPLKPGKVDPVALTLADGSGRAASASGCSQGGTGALRFWPWMLFFMGKRRQPGRR